jgi:hypothetical protein
VFAEGIEKIVESERDLRATFDLRWKADMRAIKRWQAAHPDRPNVELTWPDHADMVVWLLEELDRDMKERYSLANRLDGANGEVVRLRDSVSRALVETGEDPEPWGYVSPEISNAIIILKVARDS